MQNKTRKDAVAQKATTPTTEQNSQEKDSMPQQQYVNLDTSFVAPPASSGSSQNPFSDISNYLSVGSIRIRIQDCSLSEHEFSSCSNWQAFHLPTDINNFQHSILYLPNTIQGKLLRCDSLKPFSGIHDANWIRMEFKANDRSHGQVRVYILPNDIGGSISDRYGAFNI